MRKNKLFLSLLMVMLLSVGNVWADEVTFAFGDYKGEGTSSSGSAYTMSDKDDVTIGDTKFYGNNSYAHFYANGVTTITPASGVTITQIVLTASSSSYNGYQSSGTMTWSTGSSSASGAVVTWTGSATAAFTLSHNKQIRWTSIVVTYSKESGGTPTCATPTFSPAAGSYEGTQNVTISSTAGSTIYYTTDGSTPTASSSVYSSPIAVSADMTIKAYAVKADYEDSEVATAAYTITEGPDVTLDFTTNDSWGLPTTNTLDEKSYTSGGYTISIAGAGSGNGFKFSTNYLILGKSGAYIILPQFSSPVEKIVVVGNSGGSGSVVFNIFDGNTPVSTAVTGCTTDKTFEIEDPAVNKQYTLKVTSAHNLQLKAIKIYFGEAPEVAKPTISGEDNFVGSTSVSISHADADAIYYTTNGSTPTTSSALYSAPFSLTNTATVKAIAVKGGVSSDVAEKTFTKVEALTTMQAIFDAATSTATPTYITFSNAWVVTGVSTNGKNVYITDGTKGMILYNGGGNMGLAVGNTLSGTVQRSLKLYNGAAELDGFTTDGLTKGTASVPAVQELDADGIGALSGVNTGALIKISGACTEESSKLYVAGVQLYNSLFAYTAPTAGNNYNITGVYVQYNSTKEILPRSAEDIDVIVDPDKVATPTFSPAGGEYNEAQSVTIACATEDATIYYTIDGTNPSTSSSAYSSAIAVSETTTIKAFAVKDGMIDSDIASATYTISAGGDPTPTVTFNYEDYKGEGTSSSGSEYTMVKTDIVSIGDTKFYGNNNQAHFYANGVTTITPATGITITQIVLTATAANYNGYQSNGTVTASTGSLSHEEAVVTWTGSSDAAFTISHDKQIRWTTIVVTYEAADPSAPALAVSPTAIDFGDIEQGESVSAQTVAVNFANLTGAVTYSGLSSPFTATGSVSASGDEITISADASTIGEYEQTLTVTSVADGKSATVTVTMNVIPVVSGDVYTKLTGSIEEGDYVIYFEGKALKNTIASSRFEYEEVTPVNNKISDPNPSIVWSISQSGEYWTIYNDAVSKYAGATGSNNQGALLDAAGDKALWSISGTGAFDITNKYQSDNSKNAYLRNNGTYGFACYAVGTGGPLVLYKAANSKAPAGLAWSTDAVVLTVGDAFTAPTLSNPNNIAADEIEITSSNTSLATVTAGVVSLVENATGEATITATFAGNDNYKAATVSYNITVNSSAPTPTSTIYRKVTATADITDGEYLIVYEGDATHDAAVFDGALDNTNIDVAMKALPVTIVNDEIVGSTDLDAAVFTIDVTAGSLQSASGLYIGKTANSNGMDKSTTEAYVNTFAITDGAAVITGAGGCTLRYNYASDQLRFRYYKSGQQTIQLYKKESVEPVEPELNYENARTGLTVGKFYTICMPQNILGVRGATFWNLNNRDENGSMVYFEEAEAPFAAGKPYIFIATAETLEVAYGEDVAGSPVANGALRGTFSAMTQSDFDAISAANGNSLIYMLVSNQLRQVAGRSGNSLGANRAYVIYNELQAGEPTPAPGRRVLAMPMNENVATGIDALGSDAQPGKIIVNGQLFIIREGKAYDATGRQVSKF